MVADQRERVDVRWHASWRDLVRGLPADVAPHLVVAGVGTAWWLAPHADGAAALRWLGLVLLTSQAIAVLQLLAVRLPAPPRAVRRLAVRGTTFVVEDGEHSVELVAPLAGVRDGRGVVRLWFTDGQAVEVPWRAFSNAELRALRRELRRRTGAPGTPLHVPVRCVGEARWSGAWHHPVLALLVAGALTALPWLLAAAGS